MFVGQVWRNGIDEIGEEVVFDGFIYKAFSPDAVEGLF